MSFYLYGFWIVTFLFILSFFYLIKVKKNFNSLKEDNQELESQNNYMSLIIHSKDKDINQLFIEKQNLKLSIDTFGIFKSDAAIENAELKNEIVDLKKEKNERATRNPKCLLFLIFKKLYEQKNFTYKYQLCDAINEDLESFKYPHKIANADYITSLCDDLIVLKDEKKK